MPQMVSLSQLLGIEVPRLHGVVHRMMAEVKLQVIPLRCGHIRILDGGESLKSK